MRTARHRSPLTFNIVAFSGFGFALFLVAISCGEASWDETLDDLDVEAAAQAVLEPDQPVNAPAQPAAPVDPAPATSASQPSPASQTGRAAPAWPRGKLINLRALAAPRDALDREVLASSPQVYLYPDFDPGAERPIVVVGMPGWGGRSENFIWTLINGLDRPELRRRLVVTAIQDTRSGGPRYQGQGDRAHANTWSMNSESVRVMHRFVRTISDGVGGARVTFVGYSTGGVAAPLASTRVAALAAELAEQDAQRPRMTIDGAVALGTGSRVLASSLKAHGQRVLFVVVPRKRPGDPRALRDDQVNRESGERSHLLLSSQGAETYLRHVQTARRHVDWHWGLVSQCRFFPEGRLDGGRGYWPNYWKPNPETMELLASFVQGHEPPAAPATTPTSCDG